MALVIALAIPAQFANAQVWKPKAKPHKKEAAKSAPTSKTRPKHKVTVKKKKVVKKKKKRRHTDDDDFTITEEDFPNDD